MLSCVPAGPEAAVNLGAVLMPVFPERVHTPQIHMALFSVIVEDSKKGPGPRGLLVQVLPKHIHKATATSFLI